jgi:hypothetical protein
MTSQNSKWLKQSLSKFASTEEKNNMILLDHSIQVLKKQEGCNPFQLKEFLLYIPSQVFENLDDEGEEKTKNKFSDRIFTTVKIKKVTFLEDLELRIFELFLDDSQHLPIYGKYGTEWYQIIYLGIEINSCDFEIVDNGIYEFDDGDCNVSFTIQLQSESGNCVEGDFVILTIPE